ncbi:Bug family tripartite tricarboxylate transporter substrate binding protein [Roseomonas sp. BN140053]|uniref:Bug family tripartite tricarboxylate transporter substrate binding protein n=1 Tax=Roseomonas sp. BN140053 TaxID=3391898 RepID=UPI0039EB44F1
MPITATRRAALALPLLAAARPALAQDTDWPRRPIRVLVPYAPGGSTDSSMRAVADRLAAWLGQPVVVENRSGGSGTIAAGAVAAAPPDGTTFLIEGIPSVVNPFVLRSLPFDYRTALVPVTQVVSVPVALAVKSALPVRTVAEFVALAREQPGKLSCGHSGNGTGAHLAGVLFQQRTGISLMTLPYRGGADAARDLASGALDCVTTAPLSVAPLAEGGRVRLLAVNSARRSPVLPDVPTLEESGVRDANLEEFLGLFAPRGTPQPIIDKLRAGVAAVLAEPEVRQRILQLGALPVGSTSAEFAALVERTRSEVEWLVRPAGLEVN